MRTPEGHRVVLRLAPLLPVLALLAGMLAGAWQAATPADDAAHGPHAPLSVADAGSRVVGDAVLPTGLSVAPLPAEPVAAGSGKEPSDAGDAVAGGRQRARYSSLPPTSRPDDVEASAPPRYRLYRVLLI